MCTERKSASNRNLSSSLIFFCLIVALAATLVPPARAADGDLDLTFGSHGWTLDSRIASPKLAIQSDGKIVVAGYTCCGSGGRNTQFGVTRYNSDGSHDTTFGTDGFVRTNFNPFSNDVPHALAIDAAGRILVVGESDAAVLGVAPTSSMTSTDQTRDTDLGFRRRAMSEILDNPGLDFALARYLADGELDTSFGTGGVVTTDVGKSTRDIATGIAVQPDGKIVVVGNTCCATGESIAVARYNADGTLDEDFGNHGLVTLDQGETVYRTLVRVALTQEGKIVIAATKLGASLANVSDLVVTRLTSQGTVDTSFGSDGETTTDLHDGSEDDVSAMRIQTNGRILVAGGDHAHLSFFALARYTAGGLLDKTFGNGGILLVSLTGFGNALVLQRDARIVVGGAVPGPNQLPQFALARYFPDGSLDPTFGNHGIAITDFPNGAVSKISSLGLQKDGKIVAAGEQGSSRVLARYQASSGCIPDETHLCLTGEPFRVSVQWTNYNTGTRAAAHAVSLNDGSGFFYFNDPNKIEVMVQVKNACRRYGHFWYFSAATTNVGYTITVTDTQTGQTETYSNPAHVLSAAVTDQSSFASCP